MFCAAYNKKRDLFTPVLDSPLTVIGAGYMSVETKAPTYRAEGTPSYQLIYIKDTKNTIAFTIGNQVFTADKDDIILYRPGETQKYSYTMNDETLSFWIHFDGTEATEIMKKLDLYDIKVLKLTDSSIPIPKTIKRIINEINTSRPYSDEIICGELYAMLSQIAQFKYLAKHNFSKIDEIINEIRLNYADNLSNEIYANKCGMSVPHFLRKFKQATGTSPLDYKLRIRMDYAKRMISSTELSINEIAQVVGYTDPFHFSRYFKKHTGYSPKEYREKISKNIDK
ncbi:MAG: AraC family transcriptional regulator [Ruminococcaceae bacterium]|nr:AraC family transcriptional regulator [Oscillospiraceae bacterium]